MEALAKELRRNIDLICIGYHYDRRTDVIEKGKALSKKIEELVSVFLSGNIFGMEEEEYIGLQNYVLQVLRDYTQALEQRDMVLMIDTLDYGVRELFMIFIDEDTVEEKNE